MNEIRDDESERAGRSMGDHLRVIIRRRWIIAPIIAASMAAAALLSAVEHPIYSAQSKIVIGQGNTLFQPQNGNVIQPFTVTMADLIKSNIVAQDVISTLGLASTPSSLLKNVSVSTNPQTSVLLLTVDAGNAEQARRIAAQFGVAFVDLVQSRFGGSTGSTGGAQPQPPISATVFDPAHVVPGEVKPRTVRNVAIAAALGIVLGLAAAFLIDQFDGTLRTRDTIEAAFGMPVIGRVPVEAFKSPPDAGAIWDERVDAGEAYRSLRAMLYSLTAQPRLRTLLVTSAAEDSGKEAVAANLARAMSNAGTYALLIEGDLREPSLDGALDLRQPGLGNVLAGDVPFAKAVRPLEVPHAARSTSARQLDFLPAGQRKANLAELLSSAGMAKLLNTTTLAYDYVLINAAPLLLFPDALQLVGVVDGVVVVADQERLAAPEANELRSVLDRLHAHSIGVVLTDSTTPRRRHNREMVLDYLEPPSQPAGRAALASDKR